MKTFFIDSKTDECKAIDIEPTLQEYYRLIGCECIDITVRRIGGGCTTSSLTTRGF